MTNPELNRQHMSELARQKVRPVPTSGPNWFAVGGLVAGVLGMVGPYLGFVGLVQPFLVFTVIMVVLSIGLSAIGLRRGASGRALAGAGLALGIVLGAELVYRVILAASLRSVPLY
jgi:hypothetical protein